MFFLCLLNIMASPSVVSGEESSRPIAQESAAPSPVSSIPPQPPEEKNRSVVSIKGLPEMDFPLIKPAPVEVWELSEGGKAFIDWKQKEANVIEANGDGKVYSRVQEGSSDAGLQPVAVHEDRNLFGRLDEINYVDGSSDIYVSPQLMATLDSSRRLVDLTLFESSAERKGGGVESLSSGRESLTATINRALNQDPASIDAVRKIIGAAETTDLSDQPADLRAQIVETIRRDLALLESVSLDRESSRLQPYKQ